MKNKFNLISIILLILSLAFPLFLPAQENEVEMADTMRSNGKIYVVIAVVSIILAGLLIFLISIDRKLNRIENEVRKD